MAKSATAARRGSKATAKARPSTKKTKGARTARRKTAARAAATRTRGKKPPAAPSPLAAAGAVVLGAAKGAAAAMAQRLAWKKSANDPILLLEQEHRRFRELLKQGEETTARATKRRLQLLETLTRELNAHELLEEHALYPALEPHAQTREIVLEGYEEHHVTDVLTAELRKVKPNDERWAAKFKVLKETLEHHLQEEEQNMFRAARGVLSREELDGLGAQMKALRAESR